MQKTQQSTLNGLLRNMAIADFERIAPHFERIDLPLRQQVMGADEPITHVLFPENSIVSIVGTTAGGEQSEVGLVGCEGAVGLAVIDGMNASPMESFVQIPGQAYRVPAKVITAASEASPALRKMLHVYAQSFLVQLSFSAMAYASANVERRLGRWLLMAQDRVGRDDVVMTHDFLSIMLGVRRPGVTVAINAVEKLGAIKRGRGIITIVDRRKLLGIAGDYYGPAEAEYRRLLGFEPRMNAASNPIIACPVREGITRFNTHLGMPLLSVLDLKASSLASLLVR